MGNEAKTKKPIYKKWWFWVVVVIVIFVYAGSRGGSSSSNNTSKSNDTATQAKNAQVSTPKDDKKYNMDKFMKVTMGMSYDQVKGILGDGTEESSSGDGDLKTVSYSWKNSDGSNMSVMIQGNKVINKAQAFILKMDAKATMDKYNKISNGMSFDQVKAVMGEGQLLSQGKIMDISTEIYSWINKDGSNMNVTFQNGKVESKAQFNLK